MGDFQQLEIWFIHEFQNLGDWLTPVMKGFTWIGYPQAYMLIIAIIYWSFDRKMGLRLAIFLSLVSSLNSILKQLIHAPRPYWIDPGIKAIKVSNGFGMPSGHAQAATVWLYAATCMKKRWFWVVAVLSITHRRLPFTNRFLKYFNRISYPFYIFHLVTISVAGYFITRMRLGTIIEFLVLCAAAFTISVICCELVKTNRVTRFLFGIKGK